MLKIDTASISALRDRLLETGGAPSIALTGARAAEAMAHPIQGDDEAAKLFDACFEGMYLMLSADGSIGPEERDLLRGAIRELTANAVRSAQIDKMCEQAAERYATEGQAKRLDDISVILKSDRVAAEAAFVLAAAMAFADNEVADEENDLLNEFADKLDIDTDRANELLDQLQGE
jgi:tellurite resistance protein